MTRYTKFVCEGCAEKCKYHSWPPEFAEKHLCLTCIITSDTELDFWTKLGPTKTETFLAMMRVLTRIHRWANANKLTQE